MNNFIEINNISFKYNKGRKVFEDFSLNLDNEETTIITGNNGSGKTTLTKLIMGILQPQNGQVNILGKSTCNLTLGQIGQLIGYVYQYPERQLFAQTVIDELTFPLIFKGIDKQTALKEANEMIEIFELEKVRDSFPFLLSYGEKKRLAIAAVLMNKPRYVILDEPTASLDKERIHILCNILNKLKEKNTGILAISHNKEFIKAHGQRVIHLEGGCIKSDSKLEN